MAAVSKLDYLKRYMDKPEKDGTKKKKKKIKKSSNIKIIDSSISFNETKGNPSHILEEEGDGEFDLQEEKPIVYAQDGTTVLTEEYNQREKQKKERWKSVSAVRNDVPSSNSSKTKRHAQRHDSSDDDDLSPLRQGQGGCDASDSDLSPIRHMNNDSDQDLSPIRRGGASSDDDISPVRTLQHTNNRHGKSNEHSRQRAESKPEVISTGKAGLKTGVELREENEMKRKRERDSLKNLDTNVSGKDAGTVRRDKSGRRINEKLEAIKKRKEEEEKLEKEEKYAKWGKGLAQEDNYQKQLQDDIHEMQKPLARLKDDEDLSNMLKQRERDGDPMAAYITKSSKKLETTGKPRYTGPVVPNRFNIWPGYRWDGVDRSNGFEKQRFLEIGKKKNLSDAAYKWSVEDM